MEEKKTTAKNVKKRNWAFVLYPESAPKDWKEQLSKTGLEGAISPLHDKDVNPTGEPKKAHYHIIICYPGPTTFNVVKSLCDNLNCPIPQALESVKGYYRYFTHKDNPEKYQYEEDTIQFFGGFQISNYMELSKAEVAEFKRKIQQIIREKDFMEYCDLLDFLMDNELWDELDIAQNHTMLFNGYIKSRKFKRMEEINGTIICDPETGEIK